MSHSLALAAMLAGIVASTAYARDPWDPETKVRRADQNAAAGVVLTKADLGLRWVGGARTPGSFKAPTCPALRPTDGDLTLTGHAESVFRNGNGGVQVDSDVEIFESAAQAKARFVRFLQPKLATCLRYDQAKSIGANGVAILKATRLKFPQVAERTAAFRVPIVYQGKTVDSDYLFLGQGRSQVYVNVIAPSVQEPQLPGFERRVARRLVDRVRA